MNGSVIKVEFILDDQAILATIQDGTARILEIKTGESLSPNLACNRVASWQSLLAPDERPTADLLKYGELLSGQFICDAGSLRGLSANKLHTLFVDLATKYPVSIELEAARLLEWQKRQAMSAEGTQNWFAAVWHLEKLANIYPADTTLQERLTSARKQLERTPISAAR